MLIVLIYMVLGYWATGKTIYANKVMFGTWNGIFLRRLCMGTILGWILIPYAIIKMLVSR